MENINQPTQTFLTRFEEEFENVSELSENQENMLASIITNKEDLKNGLPLLKRQSDYYDQNIETADKNAKAWTAQKKMYKAHSDALKKLLGKMLQRLTGGTKISGDDGISLKSSSRNGLEVDSEWLLSKYEKQTDELRAQLPDFVKVELSVDKNKLSAHLQNDNTLMLENPEKIHFKKGFSVTLK